ncbi:MHYT domain-containing protein [Streptomyces sp. NPDC127072]|uniref:MHYT domain-containing protein n=1 Tax=Streptomyces sp. NPDC127072 TaxID=3347129 RepID=UPI003664B95E
MQGTVDGFSYGMVTPVAAYVMACLGAALGLRCITRSLRTEGAWQPGWLALGAASIGCGIWTMHFIAMIGFQVQESRIRYDVGLTILSLAVAIAVVGIGVFAVGHFGSSPTALFVAGTFTGLGVAVMHYVGMAAIQVNGSLHYDAVTVGLSVAIAVVAATAALWAAVSIRGFKASLGASLVMGVAVTGMHYTGMAAVSVHLHNGSGGASWSGGSAYSLLLPMLIGPVTFLLLAGVVVMFDPLLVLGDGDWSRPVQGRRGDADQGGGGAAFRGEGGAAAQGGRGASARGGGGGAAAGGSASAQSGSLFGAPDDNRPRAYDPGARPPRRR